MFAKKGVPGEADAVIMGHDELGDELRTYCPINLGRLTKFLLSAKITERAKGLAILHRRFWHYGVNKTMMILERAGVSIDEKEIRKIVQACSTCRMWALPDRKPVTGSTMATYCSLSRA